jgi:acyl-coenzyme A synthetase/AMP-(fatty) acid ligase
MANVFARRNYQRRSGLYLFTNDPELAVSILACARIGAIHSVVLLDFQLLQ